MQNENKCPGWKEKLADTEALSAGARVNKEVAWEKLHQRLQQRTKRRKAILYWVSAACLLPFIIFFSSVFLNQNSIVATSIDNKPETAEKEIKEVKSPHKNRIVSAATISSKKKKSVVEKKIKEDVALVNTEEKKDDTITDSVVSNKAEIITAAIDSTNKTPVAIQIKRKLKVVHINELGEPAESSSSDLAHSFSFHSFPLQIAKEENYSSPWQLTYKASFISFKTKSPSN